MPERVPSLDGQHAGSDRECRLDGGGELVFLSVVLWSALLSKTSGTHLSASEEQLGLTGVLVLCVSNL